MCHFWIQTLVEDYFIILWLILWYGKSLEFTRFLVEAYFERVWEKLSYVYWGYCGAESR